MSAPRKIYSTAVLKNLPAAKQASLLDYCDGTGEERGHSLKQSSAWLKADGINASPKTISQWRSWYLLRRQLDLNQEAADEMVADCKREGIIETAAEERAAGQIFFLKLAMQQQDNLGFVRILREQSRAEMVQIMERRITLLEAEKARTKEVVNNTTLTPEEKQERIRQILGTE